jgi:hypothetical protein
MRPSKMVFFLNSLALLDVVVRWHLPYLFSIRNQGSKLNCLSLGAERGAHIRNGIAEVFGLMNGRSSIYVKLHPSSALLPKLILKPSFPLSPCLVCRFSPTVIDTRTPKAFLASAKSDYVATRKHEAQ